MNNLNLTDLFHEEDLKPTFVHSDQPGPSTSNESFLRFPREEMTENREAVLTELTTVTSQLESLQPENQQKDWPEGEDINVCIAMNEAYIQLVTDLIAKVEHALLHNKEKQAQITMANEKKKLPIQLFLPPYFKDEHNMCPPLSDEAKQKLMDTNYDPLLKEEKRWNASEVNRLREYVRKSMLEVHNEPLVVKRDDLFLRVRSAGADTSQDEVRVWREEWEQTVRKINYNSTLQLEDLCAVVSAELVDWAKIANIDFGGLRSASSLRLKWYNEVSPRWNQKPWSNEEVTMLKQLVDKDSSNTSWPMVAKNLGTNRTPWHCFEKFKADIYQNSKEWTPEEDEKLITLINLLTIGGQVMWDKVAYYMPGRNRQQVKVRYSRTLDKTVKHGKWTDQEDLLLLCAVNRLGARNWKAIAQSVPGRTDCQCRERWTSVLDKRVIAKEWTMEDDEKLLYLVNCLGRNCWAKFINFLDGRTADQCRYRFRSLLTHKIKTSLNTAQVINPENMSDYERRSIFKKLRLNRIYRKYNNMMATVDGDQEEEGINRLLEIVEAKGKAKTRNRRRNVSSDLNALIRQDFEMIAEKYKNNDPVDMDFLMNQIQVEDADLRQYHKKKHQTKTQKGEKALYTGDHSRRRSVALRKTLQEDPALKEKHDELMDSVLSEQEKIDGMYDILIDTVRRLDAHEYIGDFQRFWQESGAIIAQDCATEILTFSLDRDVETLRNGGQLNFESTLPINYGNCDLNMSLQKARPLMIHSALKYFIRADNSIDDTYFPMPTEFTNNVDPSISLYLPLSKEVTKSEAYLKTKVLLRKAIIEPMIYEAACMSNRAIENLEAMREHLERRQEEEYAITSGMRLLPARLTAEEVQKRVNQTEGLRERRSLQRKLAKATNVDQEPRLEEASRSNGENLELEEERIIIYDNPAEIENDLAIDDDMSFSPTIDVEGLPAQEAAPSTDNTVSKPASRGARQIAKNETVESKIAPAGSCITRSISRNSGKINKAQIEKDKEAELEGAEEVGPLKRRLSSRKGNPLKIARLDGNDQEEDV